MNNDEQRGSVMIDYLPEQEMGTICNCADCLLAKKIEQFFPDRSECQRAVLDELWNRMECAEMDLAYEAAIRDGSWPHATVTGLNNFVCQILSEI